MSDIFDYNGDSPPYLFNHSPNHHYNDLEPNQLRLPSLPLPELQQLPTPATPPSSVLVFQSPLHLLADTALANESVTSLVTPFSLVSTPDTLPSPELQYLDSPVVHSPIDYHRVAEGCRPVDEDGNSPRIVGCPVVNADPDPPSPEPVQAPVPEPFFPATAPSPIPFEPPPPAPPSPRPLPLIPGLENQENNPPAPDFTPPRCIREDNDNRPHPHQYVVIGTPRRPEWRPYNELYLDAPLELPLATDLIAHPPRFPTVTPFRNAAFHVLNLIPSNQPLAHLFEIPPVPICCKAGRIPANDDFPLDYLWYNFAPSIIKTFSNLPAPVRAAFNNVLVILENFDLLDGRQITTYGYLKFEGNRAYVQNQTYHCEDFIRAYPHLLAYCFSPRIPPDPFTYLPVQADHLPLSTA